mmetsp:Transcript_95131/g.308026  ORF Transcript_95131/g.308026 Transcript_95131/m.308026 type:complete len:355 (+) Transcript_95131:144-1208(+)|eukprot:CAMPEP_0203903436 /NCGR_PEP_ID=MMETSP0359-20131031/45391_1 /ASSEMBLY_ACC=CAM_ASM_000338 /TAXON_ID=268821 /ORGANISM="Scrippsiella Hangoei, Strain SHTV-5" /LENGTH=354 /DNA_ID=CAMNT_0050827491 /DNA_START=77 /DNA_END=1141 /DNA_ORIENTATION=-
MTEPQGSSQAPPAEGDVQATGPSSAVGGESGDKPLLVKDVAGKRNTVVINTPSTLTDAADALISHDRTAVLVLDEHGKVSGAITENDILQAYLIGMPWHYSVTAWLLTDTARLPQFLVGVLTLPPSAPLADAAATMRERASGEFACRHVVVQEEGEELPYGILSALDLARALCACSPTSPAFRRLRGRTVAEVMKPRAALPVLARSATLLQAVDEMAFAHQNCVLIAAAAEGVQAGGGGEGPWPGLASPEEAPLGDIIGVVTPRDVLRAFVEHIPGDSRVDSWLHGLQSRWQPRAVRSDAPVADAAAVMAAASVHHLVVIEPGSSNVVGVISATDVAYHMREEEQDAPMVVGGA